jgi:glycosyltransferase involved in cell wall biosynthesis
MSNPLVSIACITYNQENFIKDAIEGFLMQKTTFPIEIIVNDDASNDNTANIIKDYVLKYPNLIVPIFQLENQYSQGINPGVEFVLPRCNGKYIALCEGDDYWTDPSKLQNQVDFLESNPDFAVCFHRVKVQKGEEILDDYLTNVPSKITTIEDLSKGNFIQTCSSVFRRDFLHIPDWINSKLNAGDYPLHMMLATKGKLFYMDECMGVYRIHSSGVYSNASIEILLKGNVYLLKTLLNNFKDHIVKSNIKNQLRPILSNLFEVYISKRKIKDACFLVIKNIRQFKIHELFRLFKTISYKSINFLLKKLKKNKQG